ncbi:MAG: hypothetical protein Q9165_006012 [Trypethelium subeluteriae]
MESDHHDAVITVLRKHLWPKQRALLGNGVLRTAPKRRGITQLAWEYKMQRLPQSSSSLLGGACQAVVNACGIMDGLDNPKVGVDIQHIQMTNLSAPKTSLSPKENFMRQIVLMAADKTASTLNDCLTSTSEKTRFFNGTIRPLESAFNNFCVQLRSHLIGKDERDQRGGREGGDGESGAMDYEDGDGRNQIGKCEAQGLQSDELAVQASGQDGEQLLKRKRSIAEEAISSGRHRKT